MMCGHYGMPGPGGSLGKCAVCGDNFALEIMMNRRIKSFKVNGIEEELYCHNRCDKTLKKNTKDGGKWEDLPEGPLRKVFSEANNKKEATNVKTIEAQKSE